MKAWTVIQNDQQYKEVLARIEALSDAPPEFSSEKGKELFLLGYLVDKYEQDRFPISLPDPVETMKIRMEELGLGVSELIEGFGDRGTASKVFARKRSLSINMIRYFSQRLSLPAELLLQPVKMDLTKNRDASRRKKGTSDRTRKKAG